MWLVRNLSRIKDYEAWPDAPIAWICPDINVRMLEKSDCVDSWCFRTHT